MNLLLQGFLCSHASKQHWKIWQRLENHVGKFKINQYWCHHLINHVPGQYLRYYRWSKTSSLWQLPLSISSYLYINKITICYRISSTGKSIHSFNSTFILPNGVRSIIDIIFLQCGTFLHVNFTGILIPKTYLYEQKKENRICQSMCIT